MNNIDLFKEYIDAQKELISLHILGVDPAYMHGHIQVSYLLLEKKITTLDEYMSMCKSNGINRYEIAAAKYFKALHAFIITKHQANIQEGLKETTPTPVEDRIFLMFFDSAHSHSDEMGDPKNYKFMGKVHAKNVESVFHATQNGESHWNEELECRSSMVGDIILDTADRQFYMISGIGLTPIPTSKSIELVILHQELLGEMFKTELTFYISDDVKEIDAAL